MYTIYNDSGYHYFNNSFISFIGKFLHKSVFLVILTKPTNIFCDSRVFWLQLFKWLLLEETVSIGICCRLQTVICNLSSAPLNIMPTVHLKQKTCDIKKFIIYWDFISFWLSLQGSTLIWTTRYGFGGRWRRLS